MLINDLESLGTQIRARRKQAGLTLDQAAHQFGVGRRLLIELEHGKRKASVETVLRVLNGLGLEMHVEHAPNGQAQETNEAVNDSFQATLSTVH